MKCNNITNNNQQSNPGHSIVSNVPTKLTTINSALEQSIVSNVQTELTTFNSLL